MRKTRRPQEKRPAWVAGQSSIWGTSPGGAVIVGLLFSDQTSCGGNRIPSCLFAVGGPREWGVPNFGESLSQQQEPQAAHQEIIRHDGHFDRDVSPGRVTVQQVTKAAKSLGENTGFSTKDLAQAMGVDERTVRTAVGWLLKKGQIVEVGERLFRTARLGKLYSAKIYRLRAEPSNVDFGGLMAVFCKR